RSYGFAPMLLLDDVFDKLDYTRISNLISMVAGQDFGQIFITDTDQERLRGIVDRITEDRAYFETRKGAFTRVD
ncbi:MAG: DNA replication and repair protein RecF, partial [Bacteroidales bacterium]|nr:DNA replication and repair protein RecF [Bacteroidales bacterium]